ncbi:MAG: SCO family protein [Acidimicrobiales bacterium]|jgi:cytochrome oxidase Cu insertion factor (SCO1/SenC/PrrC family)
MTTSTDESSASPFDAPRVDRAAAFSAGIAKIPRRTVYIGFAVMAAVALLGVLGEKFFSDEGLNPVPPKPQPVVVATIPPNIPQLDAPLHAFMGLVPLAAKPAPAIALVNQYGRVVTFPRERNKVIVLTFFNSSCNDICPVLASEISQADKDLGSKAKRVVFLTINTDPLQTAISRTVPAVSRTVLDHVGNWYLLSAPLPLLNQVWRSYGVSINVSRTTHIVAHNDLMYFIGATGRLRYRAVPYSNETPSGIYSLPPANIARWGTGIAFYAGQLIPSRP